MVLKGNRSRVGIVARGLCGGLLKPVQGVGHRYISRPCDLYREACAHK